MKVEERFDYHKDGSIRAKGQTTGGVLTGHLEVVQKRRDEAALGQLQGRQTGRRVDDLRCEGRGFQGHEDESLITASRPAAKAS